MEIFGTIGNIPLLSKGGVTFVDIPNLLSFGGNATNAHYSALVKMSTSGSYQVTAGKTLKIYAIQVWLVGAVSNSGLIELSYGDTGVGFNSAVAPTNEVKVFGVDSSIGTAAVATVNGYEFSVIGWDIPAGKYPTVRTESTSQIAFLCWGYEV